jgi:phosphoribosyl 1,2-cyclic phosphodiesterase
MLVRFWGVRGSVPWATADSIGHGCNTPCVEISDDRTGALLVLDAGSGIVGLGESLEGPPRPVPILLTHYHWDHTQGLPFFSPFFHRGWSPSVWAPKLAGVSLEWVQRIFDSPYFPVPFDHLPSRPTVTLVDTGAVEIGGFHVSVLPLNHPGGAFAYRVQGNGGAVVYATDHEFGNREIDERLAAFCRNAAAIISDAHFTPEELPKHRGWGHSSWRQVVEFASACGGGHFWLFHHKPGRSDRDISAIELEARRVFPSTSAARDSLSFEI